MCSSTQDRTLIYDRQIDDSPLERAHVGSVYFVNGLNSDEQVSTVTSVYYHNTLLLSIAIYTNK